VLLRGAAVSAGAEETQAASARASLTGSALAAIVLASLARVAASQEGNGASVSQTLLGVVTVAVLRGVGGDLSVT
jgi:hypothetical protein